MPRIRTAVAAAAAVGIVLLGVGSPALAAPPPVPDGDQLVAMSCFGPDVDSTQLFVVDPVTGAGTQIAGYDQPGCGYAGAWDDVTQRFYVYELWSNLLLAYDPATATFQTIGDLVDTSDTDLDVNALAIAPDGTAFVISGAELYSLDLATGVATLLGTLAALDLPTYAFSADPVTGTLYALSESATLFEIDPDAVTATAVGTWPLPGDGDYTWGLAIDASGTAWVVQNPGEGGEYTALWSTPLATFGDTVELSGNLVDSATAADFEGWWVAVMPAISPPAPPQPQLANTGLDAAPLALGAAVLLGAGAVAMLARRRRSA